MKKFKVQCGLGKENKTTSEFAEYLIKNHKNLNFVIIHKPIFEKGKDGKPVLVGYEDEVIFEKLPEDVANKLKSKFELQEIKPK